MSAKERQEERWIARRCRNSPGPLVDYTVHRDGEFVADISVMDTDKGRSIVAKMVAALQMEEALADVPRIVELMEQLNVLRKKHPKGGWGIAVDPDPISLEFQALSRELRTLDNKQRAALEAAKRLQS